MKKAFVGMVAGLLLATVSCFYPGCFVYGETESKINLTLPQPLQRCLQRCFPHQSEPTIYVNLEPEPLDFWMDVYLSPEMAEKLSKAPYENIEVNEQTLHNITLNGTFDSWEDLRATNWRESYPLVNFGNSTVQILHSFVEYHPVSVEPAPHMGTNEPFVIEWGVTNKTLEPGEETDFWMNATFNALGKYEITKIGVDYLYEGEIYTATLNIGSYVVELSRSDKWEST